MSEHPITCDRNTSCSQKSQLKNAIKSVRLYSFETVPEYLQSNPYIRTGYRHGLTFKDCLIR